MADVPAKTDYVEEGLHSLLAQFRDSEKLRSVLQSYLEELQDREDVAQALHASLLLPDATGASLDRLGAIVGEDRRGRLDPVYRVAVGARIIKNNSSGLLSDIGAYLRTTAGDGELIFVPSYPAAFGVEVEGDVSGLEFERIAAAALSLPKAGVLFHLFLHLSASDRVFRFAPGNAVVTGVQYGLAQDDFTGGGFLAAAFSNGED